MRKTQYSVTNFLHYGDEYLFILRDSKRKIDGGKLNGIGGKVEEGEDFLGAAIRETKEETGLTIEEKDVKLSGVVRLHGGYEDDWMMCFFSIELLSKEIPLGMKIPEGELLWLHKDEVLKSKFVLVDDLYYTWDKITQDGEIFFMNATVNNQEKITTHSLSSISL